MRYRRRKPVVFGRVPVWGPRAAGPKYLTKGIADIDSVLLGLATEFVTRGSIVWDIGANLGLSKAVTTDLRRHGYLIFDGQVAAQNRNELESVPWNTVAIPG